MDLKLSTGSSVNRWLIGRTCVNKTAGMGSIPAVGTQGQRLYPIESMIIVRSALLNDMGQQPNTQRSTVTRNRKQRENYCCLPYAGIKTRASTKALIAMFELTSTDLGAINIEVIYTVISLNTFIFEIGMLAMMIDV